jgi:hypothetical protein
MSAVWRNLLVGIVLVVFRSTAAFGAPPADLVVGTWEFDPARSTFTPGPGPKSETRAYDGNTDFNTVSWVSVDAAGKRVSGQAEFHFDGKDYPTPGSADYDAISLKRVDNATVEAILKKAGRVVGRSLRVISGDGKLMTLSVTLTNAKGVAVKEMWVFMKSNR